MYRRICLGLLALLIATPTLAQSTDGLKVRVDRSTNSADPDDVPDVTLANAADGFQVSTGPAAVVWNPANAASGEYRLSATFTLTEPSDHANYYGLVWGGGDLDGATQNYMYFLIAQNGTYIIKHRADDNTVHDVQGRTAHDAIVRPDDTGQSVNALEVRVGSEQTDFVVNGTVVHTAAVGSADGVWGVRVNHRIPGVVVEGLGVGM